MLSKSDLQALRQCPRRLWLEKHDPKQKPQLDPAMQRRIEDGNRVGEKARLRLGPAIHWQQHVGDHAEASRAALAELRAGRTGVEVPLVVNEDLYTRADAIIPAAGGGFILQETKASTFKTRPDGVTPAKPKPHHLEDVAIQAWVMANSGLQMKTAELNLLDNSWKYPGDGNYTGLFRQQDVTAEVASLAAQVGDWIAGAKTVIAGELPNVQTGPQCMAPHQCPFLDHCKTLDQTEIAHPIDLLPGSEGKNLARKLRQERGYQSLLDAKPDELVGKEEKLYRRIHDAHRTGDIQFDRKAEAELAALPYPRYYLDFEGIDLPIPIWTGVRPFEQVPFQFSCHIEHDPRNFTHEEFLDLSGQDPSIPCIEALSKTLGRKDGPVIVYSATYERTTLRRLAERHPKYADTLGALEARLCDLLPIVKEHYYAPGMAGSFSLKAVLPTIAPELQYDQLDEVQSGTLAQVAYIEAALTEDTAAEKKAQLDEDLRRYCRLDTWAMVEVAFRLAGQKKPDRPVEG
jgi:hypothetical protein